MLGRLQADIDRAMGPGQVEVSRNARGVIVLEATDPARRLTVSNVSGDDVLGLSAAILTGPDLGEQPAVLGPAAGTLIPYNFAATNGSFNLSVRGVFNDTITLDQSYPADGGQLIVDEINSQIAASPAIAGYVEAYLDDDSGIAFRSTELGPTTSLIVSAVSDMQGLVLAGTASGTQLTGTQASLSGNVDVSAGVDFNSGGPHRFRLAVDGQPEVEVDLSGTTRVPARFSNTLDVSAGVDFTAVPNTFDLLVAGYPNTTIDLSGVNTTLASGPNDSAPPGIVTHLQDQIDAQLGAGVVTVGLDSANRLQLETVNAGASTSITVSNPTGDVATGLFPVVGTSVGAEQGGAGVVNLVANAVNTALAAAGQDSVDVSISEFGTLVISSPSYGAQSEIRISDIENTFGMLFPGASTGENFTSVATVGGRLDVRLSSGTSLISNRQTGVFGDEPAGLSNYTGFQVWLGSGQGNGVPKAGDSFTVSFNSAGSNDNSNALAMFDLGTASILSNGNLGLLGAYGQIVEEVGILTSQTRTSQEASVSLLRQSEATLQSKAGVNIDEEAANLIKFEQHYNASAQLISIARSLFDALLQI
jgi:hypothetical protein